MIIFINISHAQEAVVSGGGYFKQSNASISWSLGEIMTETFRSENVILTQGFQQSQLTITSVEEHPELAFKIDAFPNPVREYVNLKIDADNFDNLDYQLYDMKGFLIKHKKIDSEITHISLADQKPAIYILRITEGNKVLKTFRIIKQ